MTATATPEEDDDLAPEDTVALALVAALGEDMAEIVTQRLGGQHLTPAALTAAVLALFGPTAAERVRETLPSLSECVHIPQHLEGKGKATAAEIARLAGEGAPIAIIAARTGYTVRHVRRIIASHREKSRP